MTEQYEIVHENAGQAGRYWIDLGGGLEAEMTYRWQAEGVMLVNHTGVPRAFEGRGIALQLVKRAVADARQSGFRVIAQCPYVAVQYRRHPDWADTLFRPS